MAAGLPPLALLGILPTGSPLSTARTMSGEGGTTHLVNVSVDDTDMRTDESEPVEQEKNRVSSLVTGQLPMALAGGRPPTHAGRRRMPARGRGAAP